MSIHEHVPKQIQEGSAGVGWAKAAELVKVARSDRDRFDCERWSQNAQTMPKEQFKHEVEKHLTGQDSEPSDVIYFKLYKSQIPVVEEAIETAALMLGSDKSRGYCLEMICAASWPELTPREEIPKCYSIPWCAPINSWQENREFSFWPNSETKMPRSSQVDPDISKKLRLQILRRDSWRCQICGSMRQLEVHHQLFRSRGGQGIESNLVTLCHGCHVQNPLRVRLKNELHFPCCLRSPAIIRQPVWRKLARINHLGPYWCQISLVCHLLDGNLRS